MKTPISTKRAMFLWIGSLLLVAALLVWAIVWKYGNGSWLTTAYERNVRKMELINVMRTNLLASVEAEKSAVMAETDEESRTFADQSIKASAAVEEARKALALILESNKDKETELLQHFSDCWENLQKVDREILALAVQNTNLKAMKLSFVPAREAIQRLESSLDRLMDSSVSSPDAPRITRLSSSALSDAKSIYMLQAPHIAETSDHAMDEMEATMKHLDDQVSIALDDLRNVVNEAGRSFLDSARDAYDNFRGINARIVDLSRQNSNIKSMAISLGKKRNVTAQCLDLIAALDKSVNDSMKFSATR